MLIVLLALASLNGAIDSTEPVTFEASRPTPVSLLSPHGTWDFLCTAPCTAKLPIGGHSIHTGGGNSGLIERHDLILVRAGGATITLNNAPTWRRPLGIGLLASGIPVVALGVPITLVASFVALGGTGGSGAVFAAPALVAVVGIAGIVAGSVLLGLADEPGMIRF